MSCPHNRNSDKKRLQSIAFSAPLIKGTIVTEEGEVIDIADYLGVQKTDADPQLAKAQNLYPYIRDRVIFKDGKTCTLTALIDALLGKIVEAGVVYSDELRLDYVPLGGDWSGS